MLLVGRVPRQQLTATSKPLWLGLTRGQRALDASTLLTVGRIGGGSISRRLRDVICQPLLTALRRGVGSRRRGLTLLGSLDPVYGPSEPRGKTTPPKPGGAWHIHTTTSIQLWAGGKIKHVPLGKMAFEAHAQSTHPPSRKASVWNQHAYT